MLPPMRVAEAAPSEAPELMPIICGSASGFLNMLCICTPARDRPLPAIIAVIILGSLILVIMTAISASPEPLILEP